MFFDLDNDYKITKTDYKKSNTIVVDNGTYELKGGYQGGNPQIIFKNEFYKDIEGIKFTGTREKYKYSPFYNDMIAGFHCLEENLDQCFQYLGVRKCKNLIITDAIYSPTRKELLRFLFDVYRFEKIQVGIDAVYSYFYNKKFNKILQGNDGNPFIIISLSHSASYVYLMTDSNILDVYKICYGGKIATKYISNLLRYNHREFNTDFSCLVKVLKCALDYNKDTQIIFNEIKSGDYSHCLFLGSDEEEEVVEESKKSTSNLKPAKKKNLSLKGHLLYQKLSNMNREKEATLTPGMYKIKVYQVNARIQKIFTSLENNIFKLQETYDKTVDFDSFVNRKKQKYEGLCRELELRSKYRRDSRNRKAYEFSLLFKTGELTEEEKNYKKKIEEAGILEIDDKIIEERDKLLDEICKYDPSFSFSSSNTLDLLQGKNINKIMVNIDLYRTTEILFEPSIIGLNQMGLGEILEKILKKEKISTIFITGGFSQIEGLSKRIELEANVYSYHGPVNVVLAENPSLDAFKGATFNDLFKTYSYDEYKEKGIDEIFEETF